MTKQLTGVAAEQVQSRLVLIRDLQAEIKGAVSLFVALEGLGNRQWSLTADGQSVVLEDEDEK